MENNNNVNKDDNNPSVPANFVTIVQLKERWIKQQQQQQQKTVNEANVVNNKEPDTSCSKPATRNRPIRRNKQRVSRQEAEKVDAKPATEEDKGAANGHEVKKEKRVKKWGAKRKMKKEEIRASEEVARGVHAQAKGVKVDYKEKAVRVEEKEEEDVARIHHAVGGRVAQVLPMLSGEKGEKMRGKSEDVIVERKVLTVEIGNMKLSEGGRGMVNGGGGNVRVINRGRGQVNVGDWRRFTHREGSKGYGKSGNGRMVWVKKGGIAGDHAGGLQSSI